MSGNGKQTCISDRLPKIRYGVSDSSNLEQGSVRFPSSVIMDYCCGGLVSVVNNPVDRKSRLPVFREWEIPYEIFQI